MSLGVLNNLSAVYAENNLNNTNNSLSTTLQQLSSGSKINSGADDAAGLSLVNGLQANQMALTQSATNATEGVGLLQVADGALSQVTSLLNRAVTLATEASNGTLNSTQDLAANQEYQSILSEINNIGATTTYNQEQVFNSQTAIYTGDSSSSGSSIDQLSIRSLSSTNIGDSNGQMSYSNGQSNVFIDLSNGGTNAALTDSLTGGTNGTTTITVGYMTQGSNGSAVQATANITVGQGTNYANTAQGLISAINNSGLGLNASFGTAQSAGSGAVATATAADAQTSTLKTSSLDTGIIITGKQIGANTAGTDGVGEIGTLTITNNTSQADAQGSVLAGTLNITDSQGISHSVTLGTANQTDTLANLATYVNQQGWGVAAGYDVNPGTDSANIVFTSSSSKAGVSQTSATLTASGTGTDTVALSGQPTASGTASATTLATITGTPTAAGVLTIGTNTITVANAETLSTLESSINDGNYGVSASLNSAGTSLTLTSANSVAPATLTDTATGQTLTAVNTTSSAYYGIGISSAAGVSDTTTGGGSNVVGISTDSNGTGGVATISYSDAAGVSLASTSLSSQSSAQAALTALNSAISDVSAQDGYIGAQINTLNSVSQVLATQQENVQSAQNAVQATDYAQASSNMSKYEILSQTGIAALAQANSVQQEVTKLLQ